MIMDAMKQAREMHRKAVETTYDGKCKIFEIQSMKDPGTKVTRQVEVMVAEDVACHLSFSGAAPASGSETVTVVAQTIKLFLAPELEVKPGSRIEVIQQGRTESYGRSGKAAVYSSHQEILLELWKGYA